MELSFQPSFFKENAFLEHSVIFLIDQISLLAIVLLILKNQMLYQFFFIIKKLLFKCFQVPI